MNTLGRLQTPSCQNCPGKAAHCEVNINISHHGGESKEWTPPVKSVFTLGKPVNVTFQKLCRFTSGLSGGLLDVGHIFADSRAGDLQIVLYFPPAGRLHYKGCRERERGGREACQPLIPSILTDAGEVSG